MAAPAAAAAGAAPAAKKEEKKVEVEEEEEVRGNYLNLGSKGLLTVLAKSGPDHRRERGEVVHNQVRARGCRGAKEGKNIEVEEEEKKVLITGFKTGAVQEWSQGAGHAKLVVRSSVLAHPYPPPLLHHISLCLPCSPCRTWVSPCLTRLFYPSLRA